MENTSGMKKITIRTPEDIIETAVDMLGYRPEDSLVLLGIMDPNTEGPGLGVLPTRSAICWSTPAMTWGGPCG
ncbi:hypothetical protein, partial [Brevibacterium paucivorans]|uniref:hypothetical protein n=1 Tax=Brevibacterium paucivorans TaxID=170994 RepID=UPI0015E0C567